MTKKANKSTDELTAEELERKAEELRKQAGEKKRAEREKAKEEERRQQRIKLEESAIAEVKETGPKMKELVHRLSDLLEFTPVMPNTGGVYSPFENPERVKQAYEKHGSMSYVATYGRFTFRIIAKPIKTIKVTSFRYREEVCGAVQLYIEDGYKKHKSSTVKSWDFDVKRWRKFIKDIKEIADARSRRESAAQKEEKRIQAVLEEHFETVHRVDRPFISRGPGRGGYQAAHFEAEVTNKQGKWLKLKNLRANDDGSVRATHTVTIQNTFYADGTQEPDLEPLKTIGLID